PFPLSPLYPPPPRPALFPYTTLFRSLLRRLDLRDRRGLRHPDRAARARSRDVVTVRRDEASHDGVAPHAAHREPQRSLAPRDGRSEEHTSELQSRENLVCRLLLEKKN